MSAKRVTRGDVARAAGTSEAVVSYVVNNGPRPVASETRRRVLQAIETTGYRPNTIAKALASGSSGALGLVVPDIANPFFAALGRAIEDEVFASGRVLLVGNSAESGEREARLVSSFIERQVDGLLYVGVGHHAHVEQALSAGVPVVVLDRYDPTLGVASVVVDNFEGAVIATQHLIDHGYRRIATVAGPSALFTAVERIGGWRKALKSAGLPNGDDLLVQAPFNRAGGYEAASGLFDTNMPDAVLVASEQQAIGLLAAAAERGIRVPEDVAMISFDGTDESRFSTPPLTTITQPFGEIARYAVALARPLDADETKHLTCEVQLVRRRSCGCSYPMNENHQAPTELANTEDAWQSPPKEEPSMNRTVRVAGAVVAAAAMSLTAGCTAGGGSGSGTTGTQTITFVTPHQGVYDDVITSFEADHPNIKVDLQVIPFTEIAAQTQARLGSKDSSIDLIAVDPPRLPSMVQKGFLVDVSGDAKTMKQDLTAGGVKSVTWKDKQWAYPLWTSDNFLFYNKDLLAAAGVTAPAADNASRWTWEQALDAAKTSQSAGAQYGFAFEQVDAYYALQPVLMSMGAGTGLSGTGNLTPSVDTADWKKFGEWYKTLYADGLSPKGIQSAQMPDLFKSGKVAFYVAGPARITDLQKSALANKWGMAPLPYEDGGKVVTPTDSWAVGVSAYSEHKEAAQEFARYLSLNSDAAVGTSTRFNLPPVNQKAYPKYIHYIDGVAPEQTKQYGSLLTTDSDEHAARRPSSIGYVDFETVVNKAFADIRSGGDVDSILGDAQSTLERQLAQYK